MEDTTFPPAPVALFSGPLPRRRGELAPATAVAREQKRPRTDHAFEKRAAVLANAAQWSPPPADPRETHWRHQHWAAKRSNVLQAMHDVNCSAQQVDAFINCGAMARSEWSESKQRRRLSAFYCHCRHCEPCARSKANKIAANLKKHLAHARANEFRLITLTLKHSKAPLQDQIERLYKSFRKLRSTPLWKRTQVGGAFILEVKWTGSQWHPHLHLVSQGKYLDKFKLSELWKKATGDSFIVDLKVITRTEDAAHYVTKYITKSTSDSVWNDRTAAQEWILASKGLRTCNTFGSWRKFPLLKVADAGNDWTVEDSLIRIMERARSGERVARDILNSLRPPGQATEVQISDGPVPSTSDDEPPI